MNHTGKDYGEMTREELEQELREAFLDTDILDEALNDELETMRETLNRKWPLEYLYTPEESWARFLEDRAEELAPFLCPKAGAAVSSANNPRRARARAVPALLRRVLIAAAVVVLLAGAALAANSLGLWAWAPRWNAAAGRYEPAAQEVSGENPIPAALAELGITEPLYPVKLPEGFVITESHISKEPLVLVEQYAKGDRLFTVMITPIKGFVSALYQKRGTPVREYRDGKYAHYIFESEGCITAVWYTDNYATSISGNLSLGEMRRIIATIKEVP